MLNAITLHPGDRVALDPVLRSNAARCDQDRAPHEHPGHHCERHLEQVAKEVGNVAAGFSMENHVHGSSLLSSSCSSGE